jgi:glyoxylase-like metal-dependent hydrolase (beta-lactamase superfamily II)
LGGITLQTYRLPGHTKGSIALYSPEKKALFTGDAMMRNHILVYAQSLDISSPPQEFIRALSVLEKLDINSVWPAHGNVPAEKDLVTDTRAMLIDWAHHGDLEKDIKNAPKGNSVFGNPGQKRYGYQYKDLKLSYHAGHLAQIRTYMDEHNGEVE